MVIYLDTSAWLKVYVREEGRDQVEAAIASADLVASSTIACAEARAGLARRLREGAFTRHENAAVIAGLDNDWDSFARAPVSDRIAYQAGELAQRYALSGCDAVHLASAMDLFDRQDDTRFLCFDNRLADAARRAGLQTHME